MNKAFLMASVFAGAVIVPVFGAGAQVAAPDDNMVAVAADTTAQNSNIAAACGSTNLALNKQAFASSSESPALGAAAAFDGDLNTRWSSAFSDPQHVYVDLGSVQPVCKLVLNWEAAAARDFSVLTSANGSDWQEAYRTTNGNGGTQEIALNGSARYVKMQGNSRTTPYGYSLLEMGVYGPGAPAGGGGGGGAAGTSEIMSIPASSVPMPAANSAVSLKLMNGTRGRFRDDQIYWTLIGQDPATKKWTYLSSDGTLTPLNPAMNDAPGHIVKDGVNYLNIFKTLDAQKWISIPRLSAGRLYFCVGSPCYFRATNDGFAGPDFHNPTDPNRSTYFDFMEFTINESGYYGNVTRVDSFGLPLQQRLISMDGAMDEVRGEHENETRETLFNAYKNEVPAEFRHLGEMQAPFRILAPNNGEFRAGGQYGNYFDAYINQVWNEPNKPSTQNVFLCNGPVLSESAPKCAGLNRHVFENTADWPNVSRYYKNGPANYYAKFWHGHTIKSLSYGFPYDDYNQQDGLLHAINPKGVVIRVGY